jgi:hypothetical protein
MTITDKPLTELVQALSPELQLRVRRYVTELLYQQATRTRRPLQQDWAGALCDLRDQTTALDLQHQAAQWMTEGALQRSSDDVPR